MMVLILARRFQYDARDRSNLSTALAACARLSVRALPGGCSRSVSRC